MLLQTIELQNFRQFVNEKIDFSTDPERNVTLIIGENGTGKTTFAQAFFWCFYGETDFSDKIILNRSVIEKMTPDQKETVRVAIRLTHGSAEYEIIRTQEYKKAYTNRVTAANTVLNVQVKSADGNTRYLKPLECESAIQNILPKELANYFFFDGERIEKMSKEIAQISDKLDGADVREQVRKINGQITACTKIISARKDEQKRLLIRQGQCEEEKKQKENRRSELSLLDKNNQKIELYKAYTQQIYDELLAEYKEKEKNVRERLERSINEIFKSIYDGGLSLSIDEKYNISVYVTDFEGGVETSTAQSISVIFAFISAIIKMARDNQVENGDEAYSEPYPLVMDAPLSAFDKRRIKAICSAIPETAEQVIIFIKDTDGELAEDYLGTRVMKRHYFEKVDEFNTHLR